MATTNLGKVAVVPRGEYAADVQYEKLDIVQYERQSYLVKQSVQGVIPSTGSEYVLLAGRGDSSYEVAVKNGYVGTEAEWLLHIKADGSIQALQKFMTNPAETDVQVPDYGNIPSLQGYIKEMFENGGLPAEPFETKAQMASEGASLPDGQLAMVYNDTDNNGLYVKTAGTWVKSSYDPLMQSKLYVDDVNKSNIKGVVGKNLFDKSKVETGKGLGDTGATINAAGRNISGYIPVAPNTVYSFSNTNKAAFYDTNKVFVQLAPASEIGRAHV